MQPMRYGRLPDTGGIPNSIGSNDVSLDEDCCWGVRSGRHEADEMRLSSRYRRSPNSVGSNDVSRGEDCCWGVRSGLPQPQPQPQIDLRSQSSFLDSQLKAIGWSSRLPSAVRSIIGIERDARIESIGG